MIGKDFDDLGRAVADRQSRRGVFARSLRSGTQPLTRPRDASRVDALARAVATPVSRRTAIGALSGALFAAGTLRPRFAQAADISCTGATPLKCSAAGGAQICVASDWHCWSNDLCVGACKPWEFYGANGCNDTALRCYDSRADFYSPYKTRFCSVQLTDRGTYCSGGAPRTLKWGWCCKEGEVCGSQLNACTCTGEDCIERCCARGTYCATNTFSPNLCLKSCPDGSRRCGVDCCGGRTHCEGDRCVCTAPFVACGPTDCCSPKKTTPDPDSLPNWWDGWLNMMRSTSSGHRGASGSALRGSPMRAHAAAGPADALSALSSVSAQRTVTLGAFTDGHHDRAFKRKVVAARPSPPKLQAGAGLDAGSALALNALMKADAKASALIGAAAAALARSRAAMEKDDRAHGRVQMLASAHFSEQAAKALKPVPALRAAAVVALRASGTTEVIVTTEDVVALQAAVRRSGVPARLRTQLRGLGLRPAEIAGLRKRMLDIPMSQSSIAGAALIAPLADATRTTLLAGLPGELTQYARQARSHPIARGRA